MKYSSVVFSMALICGLASSAVISTALAAGTPPVSLAQNYSGQTNLAQYWVSEKYDGARAWWNGTHLLSRNGYVYNAPDWFTDALPAQVLDGELWLGHGQFQQLMQTIRDTRPDDDAWRQVRFLVFDAPRASGSFSQRQEVLAGIVGRVQVPWLQRVEQKRVSDVIQLKQWLDKVEATGGEGLILQREDKSYKSGRHEGMLKLKTYQDAEARVLGYVAGRGKYHGMTGSLLVMDDEGRQFKLGSGLSDAQRQNPPPIGAVVTYRYQGRTGSGKPRFARYLRLRPAE